MEELMCILKEINPGIVYECEEALVDDNFLDSFSIIMLVSELEEAYEIQIDAAEIIPENFNSVQKIWDMIQRLQKTA